MAQIVKLRRSSVSGQKPTNSNLQLGELALNTTDGKVYMAVSGSIGPSVQELISTNTVNTGSIHLVGPITASNLTGSFIGDGGGLYNIPITGVTNLSTISGSLDSRLDVLEAYSSSQLVPSASMSFRTLQTDVYCKNSSGAQINKGTVVRITGAVGDNPLIGVASFLTEGQSANTLGIATENIPNDGFGLVITEGVLTGVNTDGMTAGQLLFLGANGTFTTTPPTAPNHGVRLGEVLRQQQNAGSIYVRIDNGSELGEAHNVVDTTTNSSYGDLLIKSGSVWINSKNLNGNYAVTGSLTITQNLTVLGSSSLVYVTSSNLAVSASFISVNVFEPAERFGGLKVYDSGSSNATASLAWDSQNNHWVYQNASGSSYSGGMLLAGPRNSGSLGEEVGLIDGRIPKSVGGDHLDNSIISESGTTITILGDLVANSITGSFDYSNITNKPTLVSGSSQIEITGTTGYSSFSSSIATTTNDLDNRLDSIEGVTGSYATTGSNTFNGNQNINGSLTASLVSSSFKGDGSQLYNIPASGVTGLELNKIVSGFTSASVIDGYGMTVNSDLHVDGIITAKELHMSYVTTSILFESGSTKFGNTVDDVHEFTGSVRISGSLYLNDIEIGTNKLNVDTFEQYTSSNDLRIQSLEFSTSSYVQNNIFTSFTGSVDGRLNSIESVTGSYVVTSSFNNLTSSFNSFTSSYTTGSFTGSFIGDATNLTNVPFYISGSDISGNTYSKTFTKIQFDDSTGLNVDEIDPGTAFISIGSHFKDIYVSGSPILSATGSDAFEIIGLGGIQISSSITDTNGNGYVKELTFDITDISSSFDSRILEISGSLGTGGNMLNDGAFVSLVQSTPSTTWTFNHSLGQKFPIFQVFDTNDRVIIPSQITAVDTSTATITFPSAQAGRVIASLGTGPGGTTQFFASATTWSLQHNMGTEYPIVTVYDSNKNIVFPNQIKSINENIIDVYFSAPVEGHLNVAKGGHIISGSVNMSNIDTNGSGFVSSSTQITNYGFAITGSNRFNGNQTITGSVTLRNAKIDSTCSVISTNTTIFSLGSFDGANFDYVVKNGSNMRAGNIMSVWNGSNSKYTETSTMDLGDTSDITFNVSGTGQLNAVVASGTWTVEVLYRALGCS